ncbi:hypothetical protein D3C86_2135700 [compost metagenome]
MPMLSKKSLPMPGQLKMVSVITAPPKRVGMAIMTTVTTGIKALRRAWRAMTRRSPSPLARAVRM